MKHTVFENNILIKMNVSLDLKSASCLKICIFKGYISPMEA